MVVGHALVDVDTDFTRSVDKFDGQAFKELFVCQLKIEILKLVQLKIKYSGDSKTGNIRKPDVFYVRFSNGL